MNTPINIEVVYATHDSQQLAALVLEAGSTVRDAIVASGVLQTFREIDLDTATVGIHSRICTLDTVLRDLDRVEIYRPLIADPKEARHRRVALGKLTKKHAPKPVR